jgi:ribose 5-phosphate isomerase A
VCSSDLFGSTRLKIERAASDLGLSGALTLRRTAAGEPFVTDGGHWIVDASFRRIPDPEKLSRALFEIPGVVEHGLFLGLATVAVVARADGVDILHP